MLWLSSRIVETLVTVGAPWENLLGVIGAASSCPIALSSRIRTTSSILILLDVLTTG